ncbi:hypothetical protein BN77_p10283 [Rhizobium mesoamericanum STM3625]|uniref:Uncharacterized protein n=1 Tax=Rhizobium mesoamericanum STM3625 TaxID=1211777 RepID=K0PQW9_9HYPH|nr:hypothetical protein BN77_p10283 [Rhizobium mesoamericanum STM3625]
MIGAVADLFITEAITRLRERELGLEFGAFSIQTMKVTVIHALTSHIF